MSSFPGFGAYGVPPPKMFRTPCPVCGRLGRAYLRPDTIHYAWFECCDGRHNRWLKKPRPATTPETDPTRKDTTMAKIGQMFPSKYLKASDFDESGSVLTIDRVEMETVGQGKDADDKPIVYFKELEKGLVLNKTNAGIISNLHGDDTDDWEGKLVTLYATEVQFQGDMVEAIRVKKKAPKPSAAKKPAPAPAKTAAKPAREPGDDSAAEVEGDDDGDDEPVF